MKIVDEGQELLAEAERSMRSLLARAAESGDYEAVVILADWAKSISALHEHSKPGKEPRRKAASATNVVSAKARRPKLSKRTSKKYPKFFRDSDSLIKVAWSKASKSEYEHKAPWSVVQQLVFAIKKPADNNELIMMENILPLMDKAGEEIPSYQSYLSLAWLREIELVRQHGRQGYSTKPTLDLAREVKKAWDSLARRDRT